MFRRDDDMPAMGPSPADLLQADIRRRLASLKLAGPLMVAALVRPGLDHSENQELIIDALSRLLMRTVDLVGRVSATLEEEGFERINQYRIAVDIVHLVARHWTDYSAVAPETMEALVLQSMREGAKLSRGLRDAGYVAGDDETERLSSGIAAAGRIYLGMSDAVTAGHDSAVLHKSFMEHLGKMVKEKASAFGAERSTPAIKSLIREFSHLYPLIWKNDIEIIKEQLRAIDDPVERESVAQSMVPLALPPFFTRVEQAATMMMEMADSMEVFVKPAPAGEPDHVMESA